MAGDILIVETAPEARRHLEFLLRQLCLVRLTGDAGKGPQSVVPARLRLHSAAGTGDGAGYLMAEPVGGPQGLPHHYRGLSFPDEETSKAKSSSGPETPKASDSSAFPIDLEQIVGVVVELRRRNVLG